MSSLKKRVITAEDLYRFELITTPRISPDGTTVVYAQSRVDEKTKKKFNNLWVVPVLGGKPRQFTYGNHADTQPRWSPDGSMIAFLSNRGDLEKPAQLYLIPLNGGEARRLTDIKGEIRSFSWSPDGKQFVMEVCKTDKEVLEREADEQAKKLGVVARHYQRLYYKFDGYGYLPTERVHLWTANAETGKARQLTDHPIYDETGAVWSPDGKWIAFRSNRSVDPDQNLDAIDLFLIPGTGGESRKIKTPPGEKSHLSFSPDGRTIAYIGDEGSLLGYKNNNLWCVPVDESAPARNLTGKYDVHVSAYTINDMGSPEPMSPTWSVDGNTLYFQVDIHGDTRLYSLSADGEDLKQVIEKTGVVGSFNFDQGHKRLSYFYGTMTDPGQVVARDMQTGKDNLLTGVNKKLLGGIDLGKIEEVWFKGPAGNDLQGWILTPPGFDPAKKYPSIMEIHGGPQVQYGNFFMHEFYYLASKSFVVYFCNPRGGRGYGEEHTRAIWGNWGSADYADLMAWADHLAKKPYIDTARMGVTGGSYGGYMTVWIIGHTDRFKAAVTQRCVSNLISEWGSSDVNWEFQISICDNKPPFENFQKYWDHSPIKYIGNAKTPTLVIHNENDMRCPIEQGEQVFVGLKRVGVDTEFVRFPDEFHGLSRTGRTDRRIERLNHILRWFEKYLNK